ncbi:MAG: hypothetical protein NC078_12740, partial [Ruminococcus sp.]|nr:hypothetical protein [Ruminococcus sp.]
RSTVKEPDILYAMVDSAPDENCLASVLSRLPLKNEGSQRRLVRNMLHLTEESVTLPKFCEAHSLRCPEAPFHLKLRPASPEEAGLFYTLPRRDTKETARQLISVFGSVSGVLEGDSDELTKIPFITDRTVRLFRFITALSERRMPDRSKVREEPYDGYSNITDMFLPYTKKTGEQLLIACLNADMSLAGIYELPLSVGRIDEGSLRQAVRYILDSNCTAAVSAHIRSGTAEPRQQDSDYAQKLGRTAAVLGVELADHIIFGTAGKFSMRMNGLLEVRD